MVIDAVEVTGHRPVGHAISLIGSAEPRSQPAGPVGRTQHSPSDGLLTAENLHCSVARVTAVYSSSRVSNGESGGGTMNDTQSNWLSCARCTVMACTVWTASKRTGANSVGWPPPPECH